MKNVFQSSKEPLENWAGNFKYSAPKIYYPKSIEEIQSIVRKCDKIKVLGSRHSFNTIADTKGSLLLLSEMNKVVLLDKMTSTITLEGGTRYCDFVTYLHQNDYALSNLASLAHITVVGACSTATHGSGINNGNLSTSVSSLEFVDATGEVVTLSKQKNEEEFYGSVVSLGALGLITKITLDLVPSFEMKQVVYRNLSMQELKNNFDNFQMKGYSVSFFTDWKSQNINEVWIKNKVDKGNTTINDLELYGAKIATQNMHPVEDQSAENVTDQLGIPGPWYDRMTHFKMQFNPSVGKELQSEYFVSIEHAYEAMMAIERINKKISPYLFISEIRTIDSDNLWLSPCYKKRCVAFHTTWKPDLRKVISLLPLMEDQLAPFNPIPHWGKLFTMSPAALQSKFEKMDSFKELISRYDPNGKFRNEFLDKYLFAS